LDGAVAFVSLAVVSSFALSDLAAAADLIMSKKPCLDSFLTSCFDSPLVEVDA